MPKVKIPRKSTIVDMTAMCDVAFLLLTFFMLTSNFVAKEPIVVAIPSSVSEIKIPERDIVTVLIDAEGKVFFGLDTQQDRKEVLDNVGKAYSISFSDKELTEFSKISSSGVPIEKMKAFLALSIEARDSKDAALGIPTDSLNNQFKVWMKTARQVNPKLRLAIKADQKTPYKVVKGVMTTLQDINENRYNLITSLKEVSTK
ncbi:MAG: biopolymer transporter ExbD [Bacteroidota bacterium]|nr:biopolymer transporter ExbD [Odoribacter sp.]MDP3643852.1 biopolymer transporter ExbD [Bacteroidota bacterium]